MVRRCLVLAVVFLSAAGCSLAAVIGPMKVVPGELSRAQLFHLWLAEGDHWEVQFSGDIGLYHRLNSTTWVPQGEVISGSSVKHVLRWEIGVDPMWACPGLHQYEGQFALHGAAGLLWYEDEGRLNLLSLNSDEFTIDRFEGQPRRLAAGQWMTLDEPAAVFWRGEVVPIDWKTDEPNLTAQIAAAPELTGLRWSPRRVSLQAGASTELTLYIPGPACAGELTITLPKELVLQGEWQVEQECLGVRRSGETWHIPIPCLAHNESIRVSGRVKALLPPKDLVREITAQWQGQTASLSASITRGWFARGGTLRAEVRRNGEAVPGLEFILFDGRRVSTDSQGCFEVRLSPGLQPIFTAGNPNEVIWVVVQEEKPNVLEIDVTDAGLVCGDLSGALVVGYDESWRVALHGPNFHAALQENDLKMQFFGSSWMAEFAEDRAVLRPRMDAHNLNDGPWLWSEGVQGWTGLYREENWALSLDVPWSGKPKCKVRWADGGMAGSISERGFEASYTGRSFGLGFRYPQPLAWMDFEPQHLRFTTWQSGWALEQKRSDEAFKLTCAEKRILLDISSREYSAFVGLQEDSLEWGVKGESDDFVWALHLTPEQYTGELRWGQKWTLSPKLEAVGQVSLQFQPQGWSYHWQAGLLCIPTPGVAAYLYYDRTDGWGWQIGASFPISAGRWCSITN